MNKQATLFTINNDEKNDNNKDKINKEIILKENIKFIIKCEIKYLYVLLKAANYSYYVDSKPIIDDYRFDRYLYFLKKFEEEYPEFKEKDSPTIVVGDDTEIKMDWKLIEDTLNNHRNPLEILKEKLDSDAYNKIEREAIFDNELLASYFQFHHLEPEEFSKKFPQIKYNITTKNSFEKVQHSKPMLSLSNTYSLGDLKDFDTRVKKNLSDEEIEKLKYALELKLDGVSISIIYEDGILKRAVTRGNGEIGEDVTANILEIKSIPHKLKENISCEVRGEIVLPTSQFEKMNKKRLEDDELPFANPRNTASGTLKQLDPKIVRERNLDCYFFFLIDSMEEHSITMHNESIGYMEKLGFKTTKLCKVFDTIEELEEEINIWHRKKDELDYDTDGMVIKVNDSSLWNKLGSTTKSPRWAIAYKFPAEQVETNILDVTWQVGRTGKVTPVAELQVVTVSGSQVKRASLHNYDEILRKDIMIGDTAIIEKAAEIIPQVVRVLEDKRTGQEKTITPPTTCPTCNTELEAESTTTIRCPNKKCPAKIQTQIEYFVSRDAMNIIGLGSKLIEKLLEKKFIENISDIYKLNNKKDELIELEKLGEMSINNLLDSIEESKNQNFKKVLYALGIPNIGKYNANLLADRFKSLDNIRAATREELLEVDGIGPIIVESIIKYFKNEDNIYEIDLLKEYGLNFEIEETNESETKIFTGKTFLATGKLERYLRNEIKEIIEDLGGTNVGSVSKKLDYLIVGEKAGSKLKKAQEIESVQILTEEEFFNLIKK